jgi:acetoin utilization deacetylase AcuC-like enzyme
MENTANLAVYWHSSCELHSIPSHPEQPRRASLILKTLRDYFPAASFREAKRVTDNQILNAHHHSLLQSLKSKFLIVKEARETNHETIYENIDGDTVVMHCTEEAIYRAAGAAVQAVDNLLDRSAPSELIDIGFCCIRPPGHHAEPFRSMGFCFVNNTVIAAEHARLKYGIQRVAILDFDVHHGNGTDAYTRLLFRHYENQQESAIPNKPKPVFAGGFGARKLQKSTHDYELFADILAHQQQYLKEFRLQEVGSHSESTTPLFPIFYASTHVREGYPGTGAEVPAEKRTDIDRVIVNRNVPNGPLSREVFQEKWLEIIEELILYDPEFVIFSAGFDAHDDDPLADVELQDEDFYWVTRSVLDRLYESNRSKNKQVSVLSVLEGGYDLDAISRCAVQHVQAMVDAFESDRNQMAAISSDVAAVGESFTVDAAASTVTVDPRPHPDAAQQEEHEQRNHGGDEVAALQEMLAELGIHPPKQKSQVEAEN